MTTPNREARRKAAKHERASTAQDFKRKTKQGSLVELPSGNRVEIQRPGMLKFLEAGFLPDALADQITEQIKKKSGKAQDIKIIQDVAAGEDLESAISMLRAADRVTAYAVLKPEVRWHEKEIQQEDKPLDAPAVKYETIPEEDRDPDVVYTDEMELEDKMFIFQLAVGGSSDLNQFRQSTRSIVGALSPGQDVVSPTERAPVPGPG